MTTHGSLQRDALGLVHTVAIGIAGTAPSYSIAASTATLIGAVGALAPASLFYCGLLMLGITFAFVHLNRVHPDAGASYTWVSRVFHPDLGFLTGWAVLVSSALFMVSATIPAASATLALLAPELVGSKVYVIGVAIGWLLVVSMVVMRGMHVTGTMQAVMTSVEISVLALLAVIALVRYAPQAAGLLTLSTISPTAFSPGTFAAGAVIALFFFWGWDVSLNVSEETLDSGRTPGLGAALAIAVIICSFMAFAVVTLVTLSEPEIQKSGTNVVLAIADKLLPRPWSYVAVVAVMLSTVGTLETSVLQFARTLFSQARAGVLHHRWSRIHERWKTPYLATLLIAALGVLLLLMSLAFSTIDNVIQASINAIGLQVAFYYGLAGFACVWHYRHEAKRSTWRMIFAVLWPGVSSAVLWVAAVVALSRMDAATIAIGIGSVLAGFVPLYAYKRARRKRS